MTTLAASVLGVSASAFGGSMGHAGHAAADDPWSGDLRYGIYHIAAERDAMKSGGMEAGQAGRVGPESVPVSQLRRRAGT
ncbi:hypothetical protein CCZ27_15290 [Thauera sinica]|nr:hypothetical protein CCZ27_15290 [Thauera sp. K11]